MIATDKIRINLTKNSKLLQTDFQNLGFGKVFSDHMFSSEFTDGSWGNFTIEPYKPLNIFPSLRALHYGQAIFEGMKAYKDKDDQVFLFRPIENIRRLNKSAIRLDIPKFPEHVFMEALTKLIELESKWVPKKERASLYIRPFIFASDESITASASECYRLLVICSPSQLYYSGGVNVQIATHYSRSAQGGTGFAKCAGNYAGQFYPTKLSQKEGYQQIIWTDSEQHKFLEEAGTMNVFFRINDTLITAPTSDRILDGITRKSLIDLARLQNINCEVRPISVDELIRAHETGTLKEIFGTGTAAIITTVNCFEYRFKEYKLPNIKNTYAELFRKMILDIQYNRAEDPFGWRLKVC